MADEDYYSGYDTESGAGDFKGKIAGKKIPIEELENVKLKIIELLEPFIAKQCFEFGLNETPEFSDLVLRYAHDLAKTGITQNNLQVDLITQASAGFTLTRAEYERERNSAKGIARSLRQSLLNPPYSLAPDKADKLTGRIIALAGVILRNNYDIEMPNYVSTDALRGKTEGMSSHGRFGGE